MAQEPPRAFAGRGRALGAARCQLCPSPPPVAAAPGDEPDPAKEAAVWERVREVTGKDSARVSPQRPRGRPRGHRRGQAGAVWGSRSITPSPSRRRRSRPRRQAVAGWLVSPREGRGVAGGGRSVSPNACHGPSLSPSFPPCRCAEKNPFQSDPEPWGSAPVHRGAEGEHQEGGRPPPPHPRPTHDGDRPLGNLLPASVSQGTFMRNLPSGSRPRRRRARRRRKRRRHQRRLLQTPQSLRSPRRVRGSDRRRKKRMRRKMGTFWVALRRSWRPPCCPGSRWPS